MEIHKSHSKNDLIDVINLFGLPVIFSHQDNKKDLQQKLIESIDEDYKVKENYYNVKTKDDVKKFLLKRNPKKTLTIKEKKDLMDICKSIINYCKSGYRLDLSIKYDTIQDIIDDMDYIKRFGEIPSVRRACRLMNGDLKVAGIRFNPIIPPNIQASLDNKIGHNKGYFYRVSIRKSTPENPIIVYFD